MEAARCSLIRGRYARDVCCHLTRLKYMNDFMITRICHDLQCGNDCLGFVYGVVREEL